VIFGILSATTLTLLIVPLLLGGKDEAKPAANPAGGV